jgi:RNA polymerase sigma-70 factor (ECF subfamily)
MPQPDRALIQGFLDGDAACIGQIDVWIGEVVRHPALRLGNDVQDVAQQVRRKLLTSFRDGRFLGTASLRTYVWRAAQHAAIDHLRHRRSQRYPLSIDDVTEPSDPALSPEKALLLQERHALFALVLGRIEEACRELFQLIVFDELSYAEIALRLRTTEGAIKVRALRCREKAVLEYKSVTSSPAGRPLQEEPE